MTDTMARPAAAVPAPAPAEPPEPGSGAGWPPVAPPPAPADPETVPPPRTRRTARRVVAAGAALALMLGGGASGALVTDRLLDDGTVATAVRVVPASTSTIDSLSAVVAGVSPSIVTVTATGTGGTSLGSGVVLDADGLILTNAHVISSGGSLAVELADGRTAPATLVGSDTGADIALLRVDGLTGLTPATLGSDATLRVGDPVVAFGSPLGLEGTVTSGIVSALDRSVDDMSGLIQTDAAINHGNSGGALVDTAGRVVGINVAIATTGQDEGSIGLGFAIPVDTVRAVVERLTQQ
ncbi:S1C family serine protease [Micromonospora chaiyaphumensis]|uniref:Putative serine protease PepD n=1 Tax=Micromonospora chaiyaphumensis TaxID=307119 RepID=A0A1C4ZBI5_9ACTN|nr:trypsin-like peptidase domain-containing protein [Micromonospora chaiyaphumensis]SCF30101.1 putative serine protease PepD [Micromonospora chaiyaphumensis]